ncbi:Alkaline protease precursor [Phycisphaerae bacterium RAS1]|nr:Alkaline protease precursor [Phycisphaerae bacterium RAS1]
MRGTTRILRALLAGLGTAGVAAAQTVGIGPDADSKTHLYLQAATVDTQAVADARLDRAAFDAGKRFVVQLDGPMTPQRRAELEAAGVRLGDYLPTNAYLATLDQTTPAAMSAIGSVQWVGEYQDAWKISPAIGNRDVPFQTPERMALAGKGLVQLAVTLFEDEDLAAAMGRVETLGATVLDGDYVGTQGVMTIVGNSLLLPALSHEPAVQFIEESPEITLRNSTNRWIVQSNINGVTPFYTNGIRGLGQVMGLMDGRVDRNHCSFLDSANPIGPLHRKILAYNATAGADSHGTHTAGTGIGDSGTNNDLRGVAYEGKLVFATIPSFTEVAMNNALILHHNQGGRLHSNSWGNDGTTAYDGLCRGIDLFSYNNETSLVLFAVTNTSTLKNPENAKNLLAVGASQDTPNQANFCSGGSGPTSDQRRKPEIYAPGCSTISASSGTACSTRSMTGTSMACPAVTGAGLLVRQYYTDGYYPSGAAVAEDRFTPSAALVKATLLNSATDMTGIAGFPSNQEGWGRVLCDNAAYFVGDARKLIVRDVFNASGFTTGQMTEVPVTVGAAVMSLKVTLVWTEPPAAAGAGSAAINNLDLEVVAPGATLYRGNVFASGQSTTGGTGDLRNNVEQVLLNTPAAGDWIVRVKATAVNQGTQGYALVITGDVAEFDPVLLGDSNCDGVVDILDINAFTLAIADPLTYELTYPGCGLANSDMNGDGTVDILDISAFVALLGL